MIRRGLLALAAACGLAVGSARAEPPMWVVRDKNSEMVIFGSVHLLPPSLKWKPAALDRATAAAQDIWFELPQGPQTEAAAARLAGEQGVLPAGQSLFKLMPAADGARLLKVARAYGADPAVLDRLQPWLAEIMLAGAAFTRAGATEAAGVEAVVNAAAPTKVARRSFETPEQQVAIFAEAPLSEQLASLKQTVAELETDPDQFDDLVRAWMAKDLSALDREALAPLRKVSPGLFARLVTDRTAHWARTLDERLKGAGRTVVVVGVGHLVGPEGLPARLRALGYSVEGP